MEYDILVAGDHEEMVKKVREKIKEGWRPEGGATCMKSPKGDWLVCYQTITRKSKNWRKNT